jgi:hypothetical protein
MGHDPSYGAFYVNTEKLDSNSIVYSFGLGADISFDKELIRRFNLSVFGFDPTIPEKNVAHMCAKLNREGRGCNDRFYFKR